MYIKFVKQAIKHMDSFVNISAVSLSIYYEGYHSDKVFINRHPVKEVVSPALRCVGNLVTGDDVQTQVNSFITLVV